MIDEKDLEKLLRKLANQKAMKVIAYSAGRRRKVKVKYRKKSGEVVKRIVRPYELKPHRTSGRLMLYVTDNRHGAKQILSFIARNIQSAKPLKNQFEPVWEIQFPEIPWPVATVRRKKSLKKRRKARK